MHFLHGTGSVRVWSLLVCASLLAGCDGDSPSKGAVKVELDYSGFVPACIVLDTVDAENAQNADSRSYDRGRLASSDESPLTVAVFRGKGWSNRLIVTARSFESTCEGQPLETFTETFDVSTQVQTFARTFAAQDADGDLFAQRTAEVAGSDCDDQSASLFPGAACDDGDPCTDDDVCQAAACAGAARGCTPPNQQCFSPGGTCVAGACEFNQATPGTTCDLGGASGTGACSDTGECAAGEASCTNRQDDDSDGLVDCEDTDECPTGVACDDGIPCTTNDVCATNGTCAGSPLPCDPQNDCHTAGCDAGVCVQVPRSGACDDSLSCTTGDSCSAGACQGIVNCAAPQQQCRQAGTCTAGGCSYSPSPGATCNDQVPSTYQDLCDADGGCAGTPYTCAPAAQCFNGPQYLGDGGCAYAPNPGSTCMAGASIGTCLGDGGCVVGPFLYAPSNFNPSAITPGGAVNVACAATYNSTTDTWTGTNCPPVKPTSTPITLSDGRAAVVLAASDFDVTSSGSFTVEGDKPVIVAVYGAQEASLQGPVYANSVRGGRVGAGSNWAGCMTSEGGPGTAAGVHGGGGGGGGYGQAGGEGGGTDGNTALRGPPGAAATAPSAVPLRGGCRGGDGGGGGPGVGGNSGGGLQFSASGILNIDAVVSASGAGGGGGQANSTGSGGGGGGTGGTLVLEGDTVKMSSNARLTANGGGGGGGAGNSGAGGGGGNGSTTSAQGGSAGTAEAGEPGGEGGAANSPPDNGVDSSNRGGGGGGGGTGYIHVRARTATGSQCDSGAVTSPTAVLQNCPP